MRDEDYYDSDTDVAAEPREGKDDEESERQTFLAPKSAFGSKPLEVGKRCQVEIVRLLEDEIELMYKPHGDKREEPEPAEEDAMMD